MYDEIHFTSRSLTSDWIQTEYNNQSIPATFYIKSAEYTSEDLCAILPIDLLSFSAKLDMPKVNLDWQTATEVNNDYFTIERSVDGETWKELKNIEGAGNSSTTQTYSTTDDQPVIGISYYRLKQTDFNGDFEYSKIISINIDLSDMNQIQVHPNPFINEITITGSESELERITLYNVFGQEVIHLTPAIEKIKNQLKLDMTNLSPGIYFLETTSTVKKIYKQ